MRSKELNLPVAISVVILSFKQGTNIHFAVDRDEGSDEYPQRASCPGDRGDGGGVVALAWVKAITAKPVAIRGSSSFTRFSAFRQLPSLRCAASRLAASF